MNYAGSFDEVFDALGGSYVEINTSSILSENHIAKLNSLRESLPDALVTTLTYKPLIGLSTITDTSGRTTTYEYDTFGRLMSIRDPEGKAISQYDYHVKE